MEKKSLPAIYNKLLFWQRLVWLLLVIAAPIFLIRLLTQYGNFYDNVSSYNIKYAISWWLSFASNIGLIFWLVALKKSINTGKEYEEQQQAAAFGNWIRMTKRANVFLLVFLALLLASSLYEYGIYTEGGFIFFTF